MQAEMDAVPLAAPARTAAAARGVDRAERVGAGIELHVDKAHLMRRRPRDRLFQRQFAPDIDADAVAQAHAVRAAHP